MNFKNIAPDFPLILASASPRRRHLLEQIRLPFRCSPSNIDEDKPFPAIPPMPAFLAEEKAKAVSRRHENHWILGADTIVMKDQTLLGKPRDDADARKMLAILSGAEHTVITGFCILDPLARTAHREEVSTMVKMKHLSEGEIHAYIASGEPFGKAGSYAIQGIGSFMVESIIGSYTNVVGLPVCAFVRALLGCGALRIFPLPPDQDKKKDVGRSP